jgi:tRNA-splicing ligase RtcB
MIMPQHLAPKLINWASILEDKTKQQAITASHMPFIYPHLALMPDAHLGKGATVGSVIPTEGAIMPAAVGVDIGCGMIAHRTNLTKADIADYDLSFLRKDIEGRIPLSAGNYNKSYYDDRTWNSVAQLEDLAHAANFDPKTYSPNWFNQLGTLGSGNHFVEVSLDEEDRVWLFLHSGSRGVGNKIAVHHIKVAQEQMKRWYISLPDPDLSYLVEGTPEFDRYIAELRWAQSFALMNREEMMRRVEDAVEEWLKGDFDIDETVNCHHNYTVKENHFGREVWLSRKGAIDAHSGVAGLIPGSMGTRSYVVEGLGNPLALNSAPHGAGREYSRSAARKVFTSIQLEAAMEGIEYRKTDAFLDEIPQAYKDIDVIMRDAQDLVKVKHTLRQIVNVKGD